MKKIVVTRSIPEAGLKLLKKKFEVIELKLDQKSDSILLAERVAACDGLLTLLLDKIDSTIFSAAANLKIIANCAVGYNNIDVKAALDHKVMVTNTPDVLTNATAEIAFGLLISATRRIAEADRFTRSGLFKGWDPALFLGDELTGKKIGIIGMGRIGQNMAEKCRAFGMRILYHSRNPVEPEIEKRLEAVYCSQLDALLEQADVISVHTPLSSETHYFLNEARFQKMKKGMFIINTSRGEVIEEKALVKALENGIVKGAGLDVYEFEPEISRELLALDNVVLLPHIGSATVETRSKMAVLAAENLVAFFESGRPLTPVPEMGKLT